MYNFSIFPSNRAVRDAVVNVYRGDTVHVPFSHAMGYPQVSCASAEFVGKGRPVAYRINVIAKVKSHEDVRQEAV